MFLYKHPLSFLFGIPITVLYSLSGTSTSSLSENSSNPADGEQPERGRCAVRKFGAVGAVQYGDLEPLADYPDARVLLVEEALPLIKEDAIEIVS